MKVDRYSRMVALLKVSLPLIALGILSTLFLVSRAVDPPSTIPFADSEVQERLTNQQVTGPLYTGMSANGDQIEFIAETVVNSPDDVGTNISQNVDVTVDYASGLRATLEANTAETNMSEDRSRLIGDVKIVTSHGYELESELLLVRMTTPDIFSPGPVTGHTPVGPVDAGTMHYFVTEGSEGAHLVFTKGVKLIYLPQK